MVKLIIYYQQHDSLIKVAHIFSMKSFIQDFFKMFSKVPRFSASLTASRSNWSNESAEVDIELLLLKWGWLKQI